MAARGETAGAARPVCKAHGHAGPVLLDADAMAVGDEPVASRTRAECIEQNHLQIAAMNRELRVVVAGGAAERLPIDQLPETVEEGGILRLDRDSCQRIFKPKRGQFPGRVRKQVDADADRLDLGDGFEDPAGNPGLVQRQPQRQSADAGAEDDDLVHVSIPQGLCGDATLLVSLLSIWQETGFHRVLMKHIPIRVASLITWQDKPSAQVQEL
jgi:hypothetical protein